MARREARQKLMNIGAEAVRWGGSRNELNRDRKDLRPYTVEKDWTPEVERLQTRYFFRRRDVVAAQFRENGLLDDSNGR